MYRVHEQFLGPVSSLPAGIPRGFASYEKVRAPTPPVLHASGCEPFIDWLSAVGVDESAPSWDLPAMVRLLASAPDLESVSGLVFSAAIYLGNATILEADGRHWRVIDTAYPEVASGDGSRGVDVVHVVRALISGSVSESEVLQVLGTLGPPRGR